MIRRRATANLARIVEATPTSALEEPLPPDDDSEQLARECGQSFAEQLAAFRTATGRADPNEAVTQPVVDMIMRQMPEDFTFYDLERLAAADPALSERKWAEVKAAARRDLASGWLAGRAVEKLPGCAWLRAKFLAVRQALHETWRPRNAGEALILDQLAQYEMMHQQWLAIAAEWTDLPAVVLRRNRSDKNPDRPVHTVEALREAARMVALWQRLFRSTLLAFIQMRRAPTPVVFARGQINVTTGPQLNVQPAVDDTSGTIAGAKC